MVANDILLDAFTRVHESLHRTLGDITPEELVKEPHPSIGWLAWRISRVMDSNVSRLSGREQLWIGEGWAGRFGMPPEPADYGRSARHTREQVNSFRASAQQLLDYHDTTYERMKTYLSSLSADELARELDEPQYDPRPTVAVRLVSVLENAMTNEGQISYLKAYHRLGGWFPREAKDPAASASRPLKTRLLALFVKSSRIAEWRAFIWILYFGFNIIPAISFFVWQAGKAQVPTLPGCC